MRGGQRRPQLREDGAAQRVLDFYLSNEDEELSFKDLVTKFGLKETNARDIVKRLIFLRELEFVHVIRRPAHKRNGCATPSEAKPLDPASGIGFVMRQLTGQ
jgi:hypothetical protein